MGLMGSLPDLNGATGTVLFVITIFMLVAKHGNSFTSRGTGYQIYFLGWVNGVTKLSLLRLAHVGKIQRILNFSCTDFADWVHSPNRQRREGLKVRSVNNMIGQENSKSSTQSLDHVQPLIPVIHPRPTEEKLSTWQSESE